MINKMKSLAGVAGATLALFGAAALPAHAADNQVVVRDAATGGLRAATAEEAQALQSKAQPQAATARRAPATTLQRVHATSGARGARLTDEFLSYSVLVRQADGSMQEVCFGSREEAEAAAKASSSVVKTVSLPTE